MEASLYLCLSSYLFAVAISFSGLCVHPVNRNKAQQGTRAARYFIQARLTRIVGDNRNSSQSLNGCATVTAPGHFLSLLNSAIYIPKPPPPEPPLPYL